MDLVEVGICLVGVRDEDREDGWGEMQADDWLKVNSTKENKIFNFRTVSLRH